MIDASIICDYLSGQMTTGDKQKLEDWLQQDEANSSILEDFEKIWQLSTLTERSFNIRFDAREGWSALCRKLSKNDAESLQSDGSMEDFPSGIRDFLVDQA